MTCIIVNCLQLNSAGMQGVARCTAFTVRTVYLLVRVLDPSAGD